MSTSQHPIALHLEDQVGGATKLLATVMCLPLIDGIFPALVLAGGVDSVAGIIQVGLLVFGGSATVAVILAEMEGTPREQAKIVALVGAVLLPVAAAEAALAPTIESLLDMALFERFAALVIAAVAAKTASARIGEYLPRPAVIIGLGLVASFDPAGAELVLVPDATLVAKAVASAGVGVGFALAVALLSPMLREQVDIDRFRFGSAVALGVLPLSLLGLLFDQAPLAVLAVTALFAFDPSGDATLAESDDGSPADAGPEGTLADGGQEANDDAEDDRTADDPVAAEGRAPWL
ncbi:hypothetical protein G9464_15935 [Halostella sp. JP-L12]|uniref:DUF5794 domain-containing protein n=1 Tax=Halostella TaxID=1843185 RepID=UPI000EF83EB1|nr:MULTISPECIES: DUF5794 domain-containing protein [Halostella]NHN49071.1 hypothetical protein [Halostella sp. JP-L12]